MHIEKKYDELISQIGELKLLLSEARETIEAIRHGEVDAVVVKNNNIHEIGYFYHNPINPIEMKNNINN